MNREEKAAVIDQIADELGSSDAIFALDYRGITVAQIAELREKLRSTDTKLRVAKNSLSERAADQAGVADIKPMLVGPTALALVKGDAAAAAKVLSDTARALRGPLEFKGGVMSGSVLSAADVEAIAKLPSRDVLNAQLVGTIAAPLRGWPVPSTPSSPGWPSSSARSGIRGWCPGPGPRHLLMPLQLTTSQLQRHQQPPRKSRPRSLLKRPRPRPRPQPTRTLRCQTPLQRATSPQLRRRPKLLRRRSPQTDSDAADGATEADSSSAEEAPSAEA